MAASSRRVPAIHHFTNSAGDDLDSRDVPSASSDAAAFATYHVEVPTTPDNQPMNSPYNNNTTTMTMMNNNTGYIPSTSLASREGGPSNLPNHVHRVHFKDNISTSPSQESSHPHIQMAGGVFSAFCSVPGCDAKAMTDDRGVNLLPCDDCEMKICRECYRDALSEGDGVCPGCKLPYGGNRGGHRHDSEPSSQLSRTLSHNVSNSLVKIPSNEFDDCSQFLFEEPKRNYGYGNAMWPPRDTYDHNDGNVDDGNNGLTTTDLKPLVQKQRQPLARTVNISAALLSPYRILILVRMVALVLLLEWRIRHPNQDAMWLWGMSVVCEIWFTFSWLLDQLPKLCPINRVTDLDELKLKFETPNQSNPSGKSDLPGIDLFVSTADPEKEPPLVTANTILSILAADYPVEKLSCYVSDDGGALLTFEAMAEAASFASLWVPFCRKHNIEPRNPETYFNLKTDPYKNKVRADFVRDRRRVKREYDEFKVRINGLSDSIRRRSDAYNTQKEIKAMKRWKEDGNDEPMDRQKITKATWMADGTHWPGTWIVPAPQHTRGDHASIIQVMLRPPSDDPTSGGAGDGNIMDLTDIDVRLPMLVYVSREKRPGYDHNKKAGAMNALVRASAIMSNGPFILNLDCDHYIYNSQALREGVCFMMDRGGENVCYVQFPQRFEGIDPSDRYANHNTVFFDVNMRALDGIQGPVYVGTGCLFRRTALYGFDPPRSVEHDSCCCCCCFGRRKINAAIASPPEQNSSREMGYPEEEGMHLLGLNPKKFGNSSLLVESIRVAAFQGLPLADHPSVKYGRPSGALTTPRQPLLPVTIAEAVDSISCWYEDKTEWGQSVGWIYGSVTEDVVTGYRMHEKGWRSVYCVTKKDAFRGTAPINLTDRLHQVLRWATGSVEIFFSRNNALLGGPRLKLLQRIAYLNVGMYPFTSVFLIVYCFLPALSLFSNQFIVQSLNVTFLTYLLIITLTLSALAVLEIKWSGIAVEEWWRNEQFWLIGGTSAHLAAVLQGLLKVIAGIEISFTLTSKSAGDDADDEFADLYIVKWTSLMIPPCTIIMVNLVAIAVGVSRNIYSNTPEWSKLLGGVFFSFWVLAHLYPFAKGLMGRRGKTPTIVFVWSGLLATCISLLWVAIDPPSGNN